MTVPYAIACVWVRIWSFISFAGLFNVENGEKSGDDNEYHGVG